MSRIAILIPHKHTYANDRALSVALDCIIANTGVDYEILIDSETPACPYQVINRMARQTQVEYLVFSNSDIFFAPGWAEPMLAMAQPNRIVTGVTVECGAIGVNILNHHHNFGMTPDRFDRAAFERWVIEAPEVPQGNGWYFPSMHNRQAFLDAGGFDTSKGAFPDPLDADYWDRWEKSGQHIHRVLSFCYHLQAFSFADENQKSVRYQP